MRRDIQKWEPRKCPFVADSMGPRGGESHRELGAPGSDPEKHVKQRLPSQSTSLLLSPLMANNRESALVNTVCETRD